VKILLDTHYLLWSFIDPGKISESVQEMLIAEGNDIYYSQVSLWELSIHSGLSNSRGRYRPD
jgi:PIN domain nuclease of toxin-antitoxin system